MITFEICDLTTLPGEKMVEVRKDGVLIAGIYPGNVDDREDLSILGKPGQRFAIDTDINYEFDYDRVYLTLE